MKANGSTAIQSNAAKNVMASGVSSATVVPNSSAVCWIAFSPHTGNFYLVDPGTNVITEVMVNSATYKPSMVKVRMIFDGALAPDASTRSNTPRLRMAASWMPTWRQSTEGTTCTCLHRTRPASKSSPFPLWGARSTFSPSITPTAWQLQEWISVRGININCVSETLNAATAPMSVVGMSALA